MDPFPLYAFPPSLFPLQCPLPGALVTARAKDSLERAHSPKKCAAFGFLLLMVIDMLMVLMVIGMLMVTPCRVSKQLEQSLRRIRLAAAPHTRLPPSAGASREQQVFQRVAEGVAAE